MNDIAGKAGVSKRTLYDFFENKDELLLQMLVMIDVRLGDYYKKLSQQSISALEIVLLLQKKMKDETVWFCPAFYDDIIRYPRACEFLVRYKKKSLASLIILLKQGVKEGVFMAEVDFDILAHLMRERIEMSPPPPQQFGKYSHEEVGELLFLIFIRGICTDKGRKIVERYTTKEHFRENN